jgi:hypothetical protein
MMAFCYNEYNKDCSQKQTLSSTDRCSGLLEGNKVIFIRRYKMFSLFDLVKMYPGIFTKKTERNKNIFVGSYLFIPDFYDKNNNNNNKKH